MKKVPRQRGELKIIPFSHVTVFRHFVNGSGWAIERMIIYEIIGLLIVSQLFCPK